MKPDQLNLTLFYVLLGQVLSIGAFFLFSYLKQKGQNFATKEDIGAITGKIESAKGFYTERLEQLKAELSSRGHYSRVRYEREMEVYKELWPQVCDLAKAVRSLRPVIDSALKAGENEQERKTKRHQSLEVAFDSLANTTEKSRPFYPPEIWKELRELLTLCVIESREFQLQGLIPPPESLEKAQANATAINQQIEKLCEAIRTRLTQFDEPDRVAQPSEQPPK